MPELPFYNPTQPPLNIRGGVEGLDWQACIVKPLCAHPAQWALAGSQAYRRGLPDEEHISGWANVQSNNYWSSTTYANNTDNAWNINMWDGNVNANNKTNNNYVWPVRAGEWLSPRMITPHPYPLPQGERGLKSEPPMLSSPPLTGGDKGEGDLFSFENLYRCYLKCRKNKRNTINALKFEINAEENLFKLSEELMNRDYQPSRSVCFIVERPKMREIIAADFRDRVVHHLLVERLEAIYEPIFIHDSYACRKGKGLHKAVERVREFIRRGSKNGRVRLHFLHLDIKNFFMTIDKDVLCGIVEKRLLKQISPNPSLLKRGNTPLNPLLIEGKIPPLEKGYNSSIPPLEKGDQGGFYDDIFWLARVIIFHNPVENCIIKGNKSLIKHLPSHKSLFHAPKDKGLPIGNLTSQFFANVYLNELDQYVKHTLKCRYYVRYCDDFLILDESPERLKDARERIREFVTERLNISLNGRYQSVMPVSNGIDFLGYIIRQDYSLVRRRVVNNLRAKLNWFERRLGEYNPPYPPLLMGNSPSLEKRGKGRFSGISGKDELWIIKYDYELLESLRSIIASYLGHMKWADTYSLKNAILKRYEFLKEYFSLPSQFPLNKGGLRGLLPLYRYCEIFPSVKSQYIYYACLFRGMAVFFQVGSYYEFYGKPWREDALAILNLKRLKKNKRGAIYGFPVGLEREYAERLISKGISVVIIKETGRYVGRIKERLPVMKIIKKKEV